MSGNKTMYMIFEKIIVYSKQIHEYDKNVHEILENIEKLKKIASLWSMRFVLKVCRAVASSLPWDLPSHPSSARVERKISGNMASHCVKIEDAKKSGRSYVKVFFLNTHMSRY